LENTPHQFQGPLGRDTHHRLETLEYLMIVLQTKLARLKAALRSSALIRDPNAPIMRQIDETEVLIRHTTDHVARVRTEFDALDEEAHG
jgi:hypothetical protein